MPVTRVQNIKLHYLKSGKGPPMIFLHGIFYAAAGYSEFIKLLSERFTVYAIDLPMHGKSEKPARYLSVSDIADLLKHFANAHNIVEPVVCAHSAGSLIAMEYAAKYGCRELVLINPAGLPHYNSKLMLMLRLIIWKSFLNFIRSPLKLFSKAKVGAPIFFNNLFNENYWRLVEENYRKDYGPCMERIQCPTKLLWGKHDELFSMKYARRFHERISNCTLIPVPGSHDWPILKPQLIQHYLEIPQ